MKKSKIRAEVEILKFKNKRLKKELRSLYARLSDLRTQVDTNAEDLAYLMRKANELFSLRETKAL